MEQKTLFNEKVHKEKGEKILNGLKQGIENELTESIEDYECTKESEKSRKHSGR